MQIDNFTKSAQVSQFVRKTYYYLTALHHPAPPTAQQFLKMGILRIPQANLNFVHLLILFFEVEVEGVVPIDEIELFGGVNLVKDITDDELGLHSKLLSIDFRIFNSQFVDVRSYNTSHALTRKHCLNENISSTCSNLQEGAGGGHVLEKSGSEPVGVGEEGGGKYMGKKNILMLIKSEDVLAA